MQDSQAPHDAQRKDASLAAPAQKVREIRFCDLLERDEGRECEGRDRGSDEWRPEAMENRSNGRLRKCGAGFDTWQVKWRGEPVERC